MQRRSHRLGGLALLICLACAPAAQAGDGGLRFTQCFASGPLTGCATDAAIGLPGESVVSPDGRQLYVANYTGNRVNIFTRDPATGALTRRPQCFAAAAGDGCTVFPDLKRPFAIDVSPDGTGLFVTTAEDPSAAKPDALFAFVRSSDGSLLYSQCFAEAGSTGCLTTAGLDGPSGVFARDDSVYVASSDDNAVVAFTRSGNTLTFKNCVSNAAGPCATSNGRFTNPTEIVISPDGQRAFVSNYNTPYRVVTLDRAGDGALSARTDAASCVAQPGTAGCGAAPAQREATSIALSPDGKQLYVTGRYPYGGDSLTLIDVAADGTLSYRAGGCWTSPAATPAGCTAAKGMEGPNDVVVTPDGARVYVAAVDNENPTPGFGGFIVAFDRAAEGMLTQQPHQDGCVSGISNSGCAPLPGGGMISSLAESPDSQDLYAFDGSDSVGRIWSFRIDRWPVCNDMTTSTPFNTSVNIKLDCSDPNGDPVTYSILSAPAKGALGAIQGDASVNYGPLVGTSGEDSFTYQATAGGGQSKPAKVTVNVAAPSDGGGGGITRPPEEITSEISTLWAFGPRHTTNMKMRIRNIPAGAAVSIRCTKPKGKKKGCPFRARSLKVSKGRANGLTVLKKKRLGVGATLEVRITKAGMIGKVVRYLIRKNKVPRSRRLCLPPGVTKPKSC